MSHGAVSCTGTDPRTPGCAGSCRVVANRLLATRSRRRQRHVNHPAGIVCMQRQDSRTYGSLTGGDGDARRESAQRAPPGPGRGGADRGSGERRRVEAAGIACAAPRRRRAEDWAARGRLVLPPPRGTVTAQVDATQAEVMRRAEDSSTRAAAIYQHAAESPGRGHRQAAKRARRAALVVVPGSSRT